MRKIKQYCFIIFLLSVFWLLVTYIQNVIFPVRFLPHNFFILELLDKRVELLPGLLLMMGAGNIILLWLISKRFFSSPYYFLPSIIYALSPWSSYLIAAGSFYIYLLFLLLIIFYGLILLKSGCRFWGTILTAVVTAITLYSSFFLFVILPVSFTGIVILKVISFKEFKNTIILLIILTFPLLIYISGNYPGLRNIFFSEINVISDPGLLNAVNKYQGAARSKGLGGLAKISENKYIFLTEYLFLKYAKSFVPATYFTPAEKLLNFSFSPPIYLGFLIPFLYGLYKFLNPSILRKILLLSTVLVIPSVLAKPLVDLNRLVLFAPVVIFVISYGYVKMIEQKEKTKFLILLSIVIIVFQLFVTFFDIQARERDRFVKYFDQNYQIGKQ
ncbi:MAG: hypothetical protein ACD_32C00110G0011 [uncultured bacterium]|uniref:Glycosyltransferase RgtA/B/C/D-like domain-containing protein n=1 Tax=Candidatus Daviesbacteria bacterium GW2011_GWC2_40_12 TaxID=1618431 RepID=A0A0G0QYZ6_9BACT|nr:MAG: hypothetical protein ACD_32C00110G0011 [uncultured bacterium]KKQ82675.1 MAG: hypothetical protein UT04_C0052G0006 [Candidatus Daviesbacteria bacterium GW2011_GWF2_38_7]KKR17217.1 MAG: hypothetical protein UT45_C0002G0046 [Candidatus Daviesbacteria bacterium GW2011_GWA2_39_33]KKR42616.1 MAG: hypothetical protein UT77_C0001G0067 [Candidatus Daviesbacteria bacterium GW2011_GWC2_40_12]